jgi:hypothetical protein
MRHARSARFALLLALAVAAPAGRTFAAWPAGLTLNSIPGSGTGAFGGVNEAYLRPGAEPGELYAIGCNIMFWRWAYHRFTTDGTSLLLGQMYSNSVGSPGGSDVAGIPVASDGVGGCLLAYHHGSPNGLRSAHLDVAGTFFPGSGQMGYAVDSVAWSPGTALAAPGGGAWYAWSRAGVRLTRVNANGVRLPTWPARGWKVPGIPSPVANPFYGIPYLASDDAGGLFIASVDTVIRVQRIGPDTTVAPGWPAAGLRLRSALSTIFSVAPTATIIASSDPYYFAAWIEGPGPYSIYLQRFSRDGALDPAWPTAGLLLSSGDESASPDSRTFRCFPDGSGGVTATWTQIGDNPGFYACHVLADGSYASGYEGGAVNLANPGAAACAGRDGGFMAFWVDPQRKLQGAWYDANGGPDPSPELYLSDLSVDVPGRILRRALAALPDGEGGAYLLVECDFPQTGAIGSFVAHVSQHSVLDVPPAIGTRTLALEISPNPARGAFTARFTLPDDRPATIELLDVGGRRAWSREVRGAGEQSLAIEPPGTLAPGVYLVRLAHGGLSRTTRVAIVH